MEKKRIGIVELAFHNEVLRSYINLFQELSTEIVCFTNQFCFDQLYDYKDDSRIKWCIKKEDNNEEYFGNIKEQLKSCDKIVIATLDDDLDFFASFKWPSEAILLVHDYYSYFDPGRINYTGTALEKARAAKSWMQYQINGERKKINDLKAKVSKLAVPSIHVKKYVDKHYNHKNEFEVLDFAVARSVNKIKEEDKDYIQISIPGNVIPKSRNYIELVEALKLIKDDIKNKTKLTILGQAKTTYGRKVIQKLKAFESNLFSVNYYSGFIEQEEFDEVLSRTDFLLLPISNVMRYRHFKEKNGFSCVSGNINDMYYHGLPAILPNFYPLQEETERLVSRYSNTQELADILLKWINQKEYLAKAKIAPDILENIRLNSLSRAQKALS